MKSIAQAALIELIKLKTARLMNSGSTFNKIYINNVAGECNEAGVK